MRLVTFRHNQSAELRVGALSEGMIVDLQKAARMAGVHPPADMLELIVREDLHELWEQGRRVRGIPLDEATLAAPIPRPHENIICLGRNYLEHAEEMARARSDEVIPPTYFTKAVTTVNSPHGDIPFNPNVSTQIDWEAELGVVIGREARHVAPEDALEHVFGYVALNDVSARDLQYGHGGQYFYGKTLDGACPMGPCIVTADELDPGDLTVRCVINGEVKQDASTRNMIYNVPAIIANLTRVMTLLPGQIIATGTPPGVGYAREPKEFLGPGDVMETEVEGIGTLRNTVRRV